MNFIGIIPARYASTRFPGKPLAMIGDKPMIQRVYEQAKKVLREVVVATDDERIYNCVISFGGSAVMTSPNHRSGTDRCAEAYQEWCEEQEKQNNNYLRADVVINIQGDEPFIQPEQIEAIKSCFPTEIATLVNPFKKTDSLEALLNPNTPKVVFSAVTHNALYFSRSVIPYLRGIPQEQWLQSSVTFYKHIGMYAYRADILQQITSLEQSRAEQTESLEQLRWLENGLQIRVAECDSYSMGIDTPADLEKAKKMLENLQGN